MADSSSNDSNRPSQQPKDLQGLLKFCVENTKAEDAPASGSFREISPERKEWLSQALDGMTGDPIKEVKEHIKTVGVYLGSKEPTNEARTMAIDSLEQLFDWCESIDMACDFLKIGGFSILHEMMTHSDSEFRDHSFRLISALVQNNPACQKGLLDLDLLPVMLKVLESEQDFLVQCSALQAVSCVVRDSELETAEQQFLTNDGFTVLKKVLRNPGSYKRVIKVAFFLQIICSKNSQHKDIVCKLGIPELLAQEVKGEHQQDHEHVMGALLCLAKDHEPTQKMLSKTELNFKQFLQDRVKSLEGKDESEEERQYAQELLGLINSCTA